MNVGTLTISLTARTASLAKASAHVKAFETGLLASAQRANAALASVGTSFTALTIPIAALSVSSMKLFTEFEFWLYRIEGMIGIPHDQTMAWGKDVLELSKRVGKSATDMGEALYFTASAGIRSENTMKVVEASARASAAGMGQTKDVANLLTSVMNAYGEANISVAESMDILVTSIREGKVEASDLIASIDKVLPISSAMGVSFNEVGAAIAALTRTGTSASTSGMMVRRILLGLQKPTMGATRTLEGMGMTFEELRRIAGSERGGMIKALLEVKRLTDKFGEERLARVFPNLRAYIPVLDLLGENLEKNKLIWMELFDPTGNYENLIEKTADTFKVKFNTALSAAKEALIQVGNVIKQTLLPLIEKFTEKVKQFSEWWTSLPVDVQQLITKVTLIMGVLGPLLLLLSSIISVLMTFASTLIKLGLALVSPVGLLFLFASAVALIVSNMEGWKRVFRDIKELVFKNNFDKMLEENKKSLERLTNRWRLFVEDVTNKTIPLKLKTDTGREDIQRILKDIEAIQAEIQITEAKFNSIKFDGPKEEAFKYSNEREELFIDLKRQLDAVVELQKEFTELTEISRSGRKGINSYIESIRDTQLQIWQRSMSAEFAKQPVEDVGKHVKEAFLGSVDNIIAGAKEKFPEFGKMIDEYTAKFKEMFGGPPAGSFPSAGAVDTEKALRTQLERMARVGAEFHPTIKVTWEAEVRRMADGTPFEQLYRNFQLNQAKIRETSIQLGEDFDYIGKKLALYNSFVSDVEKLDLMYSPEEVEKMKQVLAELKKLKEEANKTEAAFSRMYNTIARLASSVRSLFTDLGTIMGESFQKAVKPILEVIKLLESAFRVIDNVTRIIAMMSKEKEKDTVVDIANTGAKVANTVATEVNTAAKEANAAASEISAISSAVESTEDVISTGTKVADTVATGTNTVAKETNAAAKIGNAIASAIEWLVEKLGPLGLVAAIGTVGGIVALFSSGKKKAGAAAKMADGGIVPAGFPNDTYPALLSSGETVIPPHKLPDFGKDLNNASLELRGEWRIKGRDLVYVFNEEQRRVGNVFG